MKGVAMNCVVLNGKKVVPSKVVCIARNYVEHIEELNNEKPEETALFIKTNNAITDRLILPNLGVCHYEAEISLMVIEGRFAAVAFGLDLTLRDVQERLRKQCLPWEKSKAFDNSAVFSDFVTLDVEIDSLGVELYINGELKQKGDVSLMIHKPAEILKEASRYFTFENYDIIMTGTPKGVGTFKKGDLFEGKITSYKRVLIEKRWVVE